MRDRVTMETILVAHEHNLESLHDQSVIVHLRLADTDIGNLDDEEPIEALTSRLEGLMETTGAGELDGDEWGGGYCKLFLHGPDANSIAAAVLPDLLGFPARPGSYMVKRYGAPGATEELIELGSRGCSPVM
jgi:hypothetical protein